MTMSSRIALMHAGRIEQLDTPRRIYEFPATRYAASFIGLANLFSARVIGQQDDMVTLFSDQLEREFVVRHGQPLAIDTDVSIIVRPEKVQVAQSHDDGINQLEGVIKEIAYLGDVSIYYVEVAPGVRIKFTQSNVQPLAEQPLTWEQKVLLKWSPYSCGILSQ